MISAENKGFEFFAIGEAVIDFISTAIAASLASAKKFHAYVGGQPTNLAIDLALLGKNTGIASCVGADGFGDYIIQYLKDSRVNTDRIQQTEAAPTSISIIARHTITPDFVINRGADAYLQANSGHEDVVANSRIVHSSAFALSREPARSVVMDSLRLADKNDCLVTFDPNYHPKIWPDTDEMVDKLKSVYQSVDVTKPSLDDCKRIFGKNMPPKECAERFLDWGAKVVLITMGSQGVFLAIGDSGERYRIQPENVDVADVTGAGDAFWAGYLAAILDGSSQIEAATLGQVVAEAKVGVMGPITDMPSIDALKERARSVKISRVNEK
ncbi:MAG: carbohydrate kinase family protein [Anaerolineales bacterium]